MRNLEDIERDLTAAREALSSVEGMPSEVYSRIVGYYRSVRNWNRGKREEYGERLLFGVNGLRPAAPSPSLSPISPITTGQLLLLLFVRSSCPACPPAKSAAGRLGIPVELVNTDTSDGMAEAVRRNVMSTPTAILLSVGGEEPGGRELARAGNAETIGSLVRFAE